MLGHSLVTFYAGVHVKRAITGGAAKSLCTHVPQGFKFAELFWPFAVAVLKWLDVGHSTQRRRNLEMNNLELFYTAENNQNDKQKGLEALQ